MRNSDLSFFLIIMKNNQLHSFDEDVFGYLICGILWGFSFIIPGLSSSSLLLFFGLYQPMLEGISEFDMTIIIPMAFGMLLCILLLSKVIGYAYKKHFSIVFKILFKNCHILFSEGGATHVRC